MFAWFDGPTVYGAARRAVLATLAATAFCLVSSAAQAADLQRPPEVNSVDGIASLTLYVVRNPANGLPEYSYLGQHVPPTIRVNPGDHIKLTLVNELPPVYGLDYHNMTNLHYHGMKTSPNEPADDVLDVMIMPGKKYVYDVPIPKDEAPGLYYYHPHPHGESNRQVSGGMTGAIIVNGMEKYYPNVNKVPERLILIRDQYPANYPVPAILMPGGLLHPSGYSPPCSGQGSENLTVNGDPLPTIKMLPGGVQFWRVANMSSNTFVDIKLDGSRLNVIARDGEPIDYRDRNGSGVFFQDYLLAPANRVEFFVNGPPAHANAKFRSLCVDTGPQGNATPARIIAAISPLPSNDAALAPAPASLIATHKPLTDIRTWAVAAKKTIVFTEDRSLGKFYINGETYNPNKPPTYFAKSGTVEEWTVVNKTQELHAFHIHQIHFVVEEQSKGKAPLDFQDTVTVPYQTTQKGPGTVHLLMDFSDPIIKGTFVFHCHILEHEDGGMMQKIVVQ